MFHELKTDLPAFVAVATGLKTFEIRLNDRNYRKGDILSLRATKSTGEEMKAGAPLEYVGDPVNVKVSHVMQGPCYGLQKDWCILSIQHIPTV